MNESLRTVMTSILHPAELLKLQNRELFSRQPDRPRAKPRPEPEILGIPAYHHEICRRNRQAIEALREDLVALELEVLLALAKSYALSIKSASIRALLPV